MALATPDQIVAALKDYGLNVRERPGWRIRGTGYRFDPFGQAWHHDAISEAWSDKAAEDLLTNGRSDLRGPLCNDAVDSDSTVILIAYGNANHAGRNEADVINRLRHGLAPLGDARLDPDGDTVVGNPVLWGHECRNTGSGRDPWEQLDAMERLGAALCDVNGWPPAANAGHRELTARKPDPAGFDMFAFRADIARILAGHGTPTPHPLMSEEDDMFTYTYDAAGAAPNILVLVAGGKQIRLNGKQVLTDRTKPESLATHVGAVDAPTAARFVDVFGPVIT